MTDLANKIALITGAGRGIGKAIALALASHGCHAVIAARTQSELDLLAKEIEATGRRALAMRTDVAVEDDVKRLVAATMKEFGRIDILINNAGIGSFAKVEALSTREFDDMWAVNMRGVFLMTKEVVPIMTKQKAGDIVNLASLAGRNAFIGGAGYCATKWALVGFGRCLMLEVREHNIRVITLCPGSVETTFGPADLHLKDTSRIPKAADIAQVVVNTVSMPRNVMVSEVDIRPTNPKG